ncbi:MAG: hypothetical protein M1536_06895 [Firmicutes bacterium]|nr:hypothetical protein [Bacillota bacterium]
MALNPVNPMGNLNAGNVAKAVSGEHKEKPGIIKDTVTLGERVEKKLPHFPKVGLQSADYGGDYGYIVSVPLYGLMGAAIGVGAGAVVGAGVGSVIGGPVGAVVGSIAGGVVGGVVGGSIGVHEGFKKGSAV